MPNPNVQMPGAPGLLAHSGDHTAHREGRHLYHATEPPTVPMNEQHEKELKAKGYQDEYIAQGYPKVLTFGSEKESDHVLVKDAAEEAKAVAMHTASATAAKEAK